MRTTFFLLVLAALPAVARVGSDAASPEHTLLATRAQLPAEPRTASPLQHGIPTPTLLFSMTGADNAVTVRSVADVTGDGLPEVLAGIDKSGTDNLFCLDGSSRGDASVVWSLETTDGVSGGSTTSTATPGPTSSPAPRTPPATWSSTS